jgi:F-type H+-transporting ATPase subunit b
MIELNRTLLFQIVNFLVLMGLLYLFLFKPISRFLAERSESIRKDREEAARSRAEAEGRLGEYTGLLSQAKEEIETMKDAAKAEMVQQRQKTVKEAKEEAGRLIDEAKQEIELQVRSARQELRKEVVDLSAALAEKLLKRSLREEDQHSLILDSLDQLKEKD